jgi:hypothetical protein
MYFKGWVAAALGEQANAHDSEAGIHAFTQGDLMENGVEAAGQ